MLWNRIDAHVNIEVLLVYSFLAVEDDDEDVDKDEAKYKVVDKDEAEYKGVNERSLHSFHRQSNSPRREIPFDTRPSAAFVE